MAKKPRTEPRRTNPVAKMLAQPKCRRLVVQDKRRKPPRTPVRFDADAGVLAFWGYRFAHRLDARRLEGVVAPAYDVARPRAPSEP